MDLSLRQAQYEAQGQKTQVVETQARGGSWGLWVSVAVAGIAVFITLVLGIMSIILVLLVNSGRL